MRRLVSLIFIFIAFIAFRSVLFIPGIIGHNWDWGIPNFPEQFKFQALSNFFIWDHRIYGGIFYPFKIEFFYWLLLSLTSLNGEVLSKAVPLVAIILSGLFAYLAARKVFFLNYFWASVSACLYMLSPFTYARLMAGHLPILLGYAFLPLIFYFSYFLFQKFDIIKVILLFLILSLAVPHPLMLFISWVIVFIILLVYLIAENKKRKEILVSFFILCVCFIILSSYWLVPTIFQLLTSSTGLSVRPWQPVAEEMSFRLPYFSSESRSLAELFSFSYYFGLNTEFVYPLTDSVRPFFILVSIFLFIASFFAIRKIRQTKREYFLPILMLTLIELVGLTLITGEKTIFGYFIFSLIIRFAPFIFSIFSNPLRLLPLVILPLCFLSAFTLASFEEAVSSRKFWVRPLFLFVLSIFLYPWLFRNLTEPVIKFSEQPMSLKVTKVNPEDKKVFDFLKSFPEDFRVSYLPPAFVSWPGETDLSYSWNTVFSAKPTFLEYSQPPLAAEIVNSLYSQDSSKDLSKLLGLGTAKMMIYPSYQGFESYQDFIRGTFNYKPIFDRNWESQNDFQKRSTEFKSVTISENNNYVPHVFAAEQATFIEGEKKSLLDVISFPDYKLRNAIFFSGRKENDEFSLGDYVDNIYLKPNCIACDGSFQISTTDLYPTIRFLPTSPFHILTYLSEQKLWNAMKSYPKLRANTDLFLMSKRLAELKQMVELKQDFYGVAVETTKSYQTLLDDFAETVSKKEEMDNDILIKSSYFLSEHVKNFNYIVQKTGNGEVINTIKVIFDKIDQVFPQIENNIWITNDEREKKYLFTVPQEGEYSLLASANIGEANFEIDGKIFNVKPTYSDNHWLFLTKTDLKKGSHRLKVVLPEPVNLFSGFATSSAVTKIQSSVPMGNAYQLQSLTTNILVSSELKGLDDRAQYRLSFKYRILGAPIRFALEQVNDEKVRGFIRHKIDTFFVLNEKWEKFETFFSPNFGSHEAKINFYLYSDRGQTDSYLLDDVKVEKVINPNLIFKKAIEKEPFLSPKIFFTEVNPTKYKIKVENAQKPYFLVFSETFNNGWKAYINETQDSTVNISASYFDGEIKEGEHKNIFLDREIFTDMFKKPIAEKNHLWANAFANAWYIDKLGDYEVILEFTPQRAYFAGLTISFVSITVSLVLLFGLLIKRRMGYQIKQR